MRHTAVATLLAAACSGCATDSKRGMLSSWNPAKSLSWKKDEEKKPDPQVPTRLVATWAETVLTKAGETPKRGFGGRIAFFGRDSDDPVRVDGQLVVYAFDETSREPHETQPTRKYIFPADEVGRHESSSALGPSYSFWLPWDEVGGAQTNISLIARFEPRGGPIVIGEQTRHFLPGAAPDQSKQQWAQPSRTDVLNGVRQASYSPPEVDGAPIPAQAAVARGSETSVLVKPAPKMTTETIELPPRLANALQATSLPKRNAGLNAADGGATENAPLSQLSQMKPSGPLAPTERLQTPTIQQAAASTETTQQSPSRSIAAGGPATPGSLRGSLLETLPARARQSAPAASARAR